MSQFVEVEGEIDEDEEEEVIEEQNNSKQNRIDNGEYDYNDFNQIISKMSSDNLEDVQKLGVNITNIM